VINQSSPTSVGSVYSAEMAEKIRELDARHHAKAAAGKIIRNIPSVLAILVALYLLVGLVSLMEVGEGADIPYMAFWHWPWKVLFTSIFHISG
jgi:hypothetical protein